MYTDDNIIDVDVKCSLCGCDEIEVEFDANNYKIHLTCKECGAEDFVEV